MDTHAVIAFDVDGTVTESKVPITGEMADLLCQLLARKKVALISGAPLSRFLEQLVQFLPCVIGGSEITNLILLPANGSQCYTYNTSTKNWDLIDEEKLSPEVKEKVLKAVTEALENLDLGIPKNAYGEYVEDRGTQLTLAALGQDAPLDIKASWDPDHAKRQKIKAFLDERIGELVEISIAGTTSIDIVQKGFNKARGLLRLLDRLGLAINDMLFIGDSVFPGGNDYSPKEVGIHAVKTSGPQETASIIQSILS